MADIECAHINAQVGLKMNMCAQPQKDARPDAASAITVVEDKMPEAAPVSATHAQLIESYHRIISARTLNHPVLFHFIRELGRGRQGIVFLAVRQGGRGCFTRHAVKLHDPGIYSSAEKYWSDMKRIASQISILQPIQSDNLVPRETYDEQDGIGFIQMGAIDGIDLQFLLEGTHIGIARSQSTDEEWTHFTQVLFRFEQDRFMLQPGAAFFILSKILVGMIVMHEAGFLHADIKPSNIMLDRMGSVKLVDFGRAVRIGEEISILLGSPLYMAPETHRFESGFPAADLFGAGLVAIEMLTGKPIADAATMTDEELLAFKMKLAATIHNHLPEHVVAEKAIMRLIRRFIQPDPRQRFATAKEAEEKTYQRLRSVQRKVTLATGAVPDYGREFQQYLAKITDPETGHVNPRLG